MLQQIFWIRVKIWTVVVLLLLIAGVAVWKGLPTFKAQAAVVSVGLLGAIYITYLQNLIEALEVGVKGIDLLIEAAKKAERNRKREQPDDEEE